MQLCCTTVVLGLLGALGLILLLYVAYTARRECSRRVSAHPRSDAPLLYAAGSASLAYDALAFSGGGTRALTDELGVLCALASARRADLPDLTRRAQAFTGNSGGTWMLSLLGWSGDFRSVARTAAAGDVEGGVQIFKSRWADRFPFGPTSETAKDPPEGIKDSLLELFPNFSTDYARYLGPWTAMVGDWIAQKRLLGALMSDPGQDWIAGKAVAFQGSLLQAAYLSRADFASDVHSYVLHAPTGTPRRIAAPILLGRNPGGPPLPFLMQEAAELKVEYFADSTPKSIMDGLHLLHSSNGPSNVVSVAATQLSAQAQPVVSCSAASSAALGLVPSLDFLSAHRGTFVGDEEVAVHGDVAGAFANTSVPLHLRPAGVQLDGAVDQRATMQQLKDSVALRAADGVFCDNTGVAAAVRLLQLRGLESCSLLSVVSSSEDSETLHGGARAPVGIGALFGLAPSGPVDAAHPQLFEVAGMKHVMENPRIFDPSGVGKYVVRTPAPSGYLTAPGARTQVMVVRYTGLTTVDNAAFGVRAGMAVNLDVVVCKSKLAIVPIGIDDLSRAVQVFRDICLLGPQLDAALAA